LESLLLLLASPASPCPRQQSKVRLLSLFGGSAASSLFIVASNSIGQKDTTEQLALAHAGEPIWLACTGKKILPEVSVPGKISDSYQTAPYNLGNLVPYL